MNFGPLLLQAVESSQPIAAATSSTFNWKDPIFLTAVAALITAVAAIFAPVLTAYLEQKGAQKLKTVELFYSSKTDAYTKLLSVTSHRLLSKISAEDVQDLVDAAAAAMLYSSENTREIIMKYCRSLNNKESNKYKQFGQIQRELIVAMQKELDEFKK